MLRQLLRSCVLVTYFAVLAELVSGCAQPESTIRTLRWGAIHETVDSDPSCTLTTALSDTSSNAASEFRPTKRGMLPAYLRCKSRDAIVALDVDEAWLCAGDKKHEALTIDEAIDLARFSYSGAQFVSFLFGAIPGYGVGRAAENANRDMDGEYHTGQFRPRVLNPGQEAEGLVFFSIPRGKLPQVSSAVVPIRYLRRGSKNELALGNVASCEPEIP